MFSKHQKRHLSVESKLKIITRINRGEKMSSLASEYGIGRTTIHDIYKNRAKIQEFSEAKIYRISKRQNLRTGRNPRMEEALYEWYLQEKKTGTPISSTILMTRAKEIHNEIFNTDKGFSASVGWLTGFKRRYKIKFTQEDDFWQLEEDFDDNADIEEFKNSFFRKVVDLELCPSQVYVAIENELCWRILPGDNLNRKIKKDKISFLACANASGLHKMKPLLVVNTHEAQELRSVNLPVHYVEQKLTRITEQSVKRWFDDCFALEARNWLTKHNLPPKALLIVDQSLFNVDEIATKNEAFSVLIYPTECRNMMPLDENTMKTVKQNYKRHLLLTTASRDIPMEECLNRFNVKDMVFTLAQKWQSLPAFRIAVSWKALWESMILDMEDSIVEVNTDEQYDPALVRSVAENMLFPVDALRKWFDGKYDYADNCTNEFPNPIEEHGCQTTRVQLKDAVNSFDICIQWAEQNGSTCEEIGVLRKLRDEALISKYITERKFNDDTQIFGC